MGCWANKEFGDVMCVWESPPADIGLKECDCEAFGKAMGWAGTNKDLHATDKNGAKGPSVSSARFGFASLIAMQQGRR